ncbi:unnamed protein product [Peniophora sp. CBMAI 1063]|nr:unnamed protein product [Peniophora sp. CBMAI 1063]
MSVMPPTPAGNSTTTLWATASKEWVIPPKPKPGRKPKKDASQAVASAPSPVDAPSPSSSVDPAGRRVQNRAAQRAFRERKQSQLAELQERIKQYEQGEIERNVALQQISKRVKDENDALIAENRELKDRIAQLERERDAALAAKAAALKDAELKRSRSRSPDRSEAPARKRKRTTAKDSAPASTVSNPALTLSLYDPPSLVHSPSVSNLSEQDTSPAPDPIPQQDAIYVDTMNLDFDFSLSASSSRPSVYENAVPMDTFDCGFCSDNTPCVCREIAMQSHAPSGPTFKVEAVEPSLQTISLDPAPSDEPSILDNLPAFQPAVPLRRRSDKAPAKSLFPVVPATSGDCGSGRGAVGDACSGDPSNCPACADDAFGRAFCTAVGEAVASQGPCADCPSRTAGPSQSAADAGVRLCCGNPALCGGGACAPPTNSTSVTFGNTEETMPTSEAWRQIKSHPNVEFADLRLLADVVARRSKCSGPTVVIEPALGSITPERSNTPAAGVPQSSDAILLSDPHALFKQRQERGLVSGSPPPRLVPHDELVACAQRRAPRQVQAAGVREALEMLDAQFAQT